MVGNDIFCTAPVGTGGVVMAVNTLAGEADKTQPGSTLRLSVTTARMATGSASVSPASS